MDDRATDAMAVAAETRRVIALARRAALAPSAAAAAAIIEAHLEELVFCDAATVWRCDGPPSLVRIDDDAEDRIVADGGLLGCAIRGRAPLWVDDVATDPRFDPAIDPADGTGRLLICPMTDHDGGLEALVVLWRHPRRAGFTADDGARMSQLAGELVPLLGQVRRDERARLVIERPLDEVYRKGAIAARDRRRSPGEPVATSGRGLRIAFWAVVASGVTAAAVVVATPIAQIVVGRRPSAADTGTCSAARGEFPLDVTRRAAAPLTPGARVIVMSAPARGRQGTVRECVGDPGSETVRCCLVVAGPVDALIALPAVILETGHASAVELLFGAKRR